jgi:hypothetical protein
MTQNTDTYTDMNTPPLYRICTYSVLCLYMCTHCYTFVLCYSN